MKDKTYLFESDDIFSSVLTLALPSVIGQIILVIYNLADTFFIGSTQNNDMITAVTVCMPAYMFLSAVSNLFGAGGAGTVSRCLGRGDRASASGISAFAIWGCTAAAAIYCSAAFLFRRTFIDLLGGSTSAVYYYSERYLLIVVIICGIPTAMSMLLAHLLRSEGHSVLSSIGIAGGGILNIILDPVFMFKLLPSGSEVIGAALATGLSNILAYIYYVIVLIVIRPHSVITPRLNESSFSPVLIKEVLITGGPSCLMTLCENISYAFLDKLISYAGTIAQAGVGVAKKINMLPHCIVRGISQGVLPMIAYNWASGDHGRMKKTLLVGTQLALVSAAVCMGVCLFSTGSLCGLFLPGGTESCSYACSFLRILCLGGPFSAVAYMMISFFQAVGMGRQSLILALLRKGILDIPIMLLLFSFVSTSSVVWATPAADIICCVGAAAMFIAFRKDPSYDR